jgi:hypothetical protein
MGLVSGEAGVVLTRGVIETMNVQIDIKARIPWACSKTANGNWIADCELLGLTIQSTRYSELTEDIGDALDMLFRDLLSSNELDAFLEEHGWTRTSVPLPAVPEEATFDVPFELLVAGADDPEKRFHQ